MNQQPAEGTKGEAMARGRVRTLRRATPEVRKVQDGGKVGTGIAALRGSLPQAAYGK